MCCNELQKFHPRRRHCWQAGGCGTRANMDISRARRVGYCPVCLRLRDGGGHSSTCGCTRQAHGALQATTIKRKSLKSIMGAMATILCVHPTAYRISEGSQGLQILSVVLCRARIVDPKNYRIGRDVQSPMAEEILRKTTQRRAVQFRSRIISSSTAVMSTETMGGAVSNPDEKIGGVKGVGLIEANLAPGCLTSPSPRYCARPNRPRSPGRTRKAFEMPTTVSAPPRQR